MISHPKERRDSLNSVAISIAKRLTAIRELAAESNQPASQSECALQFKLMCHKANLRGGPITTAEMSLLADMVPELAA
jgi:hypothetical protein